MKIPGFLKLTLRNILVNIDVGTMIFMLGLPTLYLFVMGQMFSSIIPSVSISGQTNSSYLDFLAPGIIALQSFTAGNIGGSMLWSDRRWGMFEQIMVGPFRRSEYILGILCVSIFFSLVGSGIMVSFSFLAGISFSTSLIGVLTSILAIVFGTMLFSLIFIIISGVVKTLEAYNTITIVLFFLLDFASTAFYPIDNKTPDWLKFIAGYNPLSYVVNSLRFSLLYNAPFSILTDVFILFIAMLLFFIMALIVYRNIKTGI
ncbi:ABC transporter permease [Caldiplasma sukawensis]